VRRIISLLLCLCLFFSLCACGGHEVKPQKPTREFTDSCGRTVQIPEEIDTVVPSGSMAQIILYSLCPEKLQSLSQAFTRIQKQYIDEKYHDLPVSGQFYGGASSVSYEAIILSSPDIIIDVGESKQDIADDMDEIQAKSGIPTIFIHADMEHLAEAYETLGEILNIPEQAKACADYIRETLEDAKSAAGQIPESDRKTVLYAQGEFGTEVAGPGTIHSEVLDYACAINAAPVDNLSSNGTEAVSMEEILKWDPDVVILAPDANYDEVWTDPLWTGMSAVRTKQVYEIPIGPYNWLDRPPSVQRVLGIKWLGNLLYPDVFDYDMAAEVQTFYELFWHYELSEEEAQSLMANSTYGE